MARTGERSDGEDPKAMRASEQAGAPFGQVEADENGTRQQKFEQTSQVSPPVSHGTTTAASGAGVVDPRPVARAGPVGGSQPESTGLPSTRVSKEVGPPPVTHRGVLDVVLPMRPEPDLDVDGEGAEQFVFPALWRKAAVA